jgi:hypothetical protein
MLHVILVQELEEENLHQISKLTVQPADMSVIWLPITYMHITLLLHKTLLGEHVQMGKLGGL